MRTLLALSLASLVLAVPASAQQETSPPAMEGGTLGYYRQPALHGNTLVFAAEGDLWTVPVTGGAARRLTTHPAEEGAPAISPDGRTLAFTAEYEGPAEVYTMPLEGGVPTRHTWDGSRDEVVGWTPTGKILYSTRRYSGLPATQLVELDPATDARRVLPLSQASDGAYDPTTGAFFFTRQDFQGSHTRRYKGGTAQSLWRWGGTAALKAAPGSGAAAGAAERSGNGTAGASGAGAAAGGEAVDLTSDFPGTSKTPMVWDGRVYFASDRDGAMNIWSMAPDGGELKQLTHHADFDVQSPALDGGRVVYQDGADLWLLDLKTGDDHRIPIRLASDFDQLRDRWIEKPMEWLTSAHISPTGDRVALTARGQVFVAPVGAGRLVEATRDSGVRYRDARFLPDGKGLLVLSDESGEVELWRLPANGVGKGEQWTRGGDVLRWEAIPSPDGKRVAHTDKNQRLWVYDVASKASRKVAESAYDDLRNLAWSPDSRWLAYSETLANGFSRLVLYDTRTGRSTPITTDRYDSFAPAWSPDGKWLYFLSDRNLVSSVGSPWGNRQPEPYFDRQTRIYALALQPGDRFPFQPKDELASKAEATTSPEKSAPDKAGATGVARDTAAAAPVPLELDGLATRLYVVPGPAGDYSDLATDGKRLYYLSGRRGPDSKLALTVLEITNEKPEAKPLVEDVRDFELSANGRKLLVRKRDTLYVLDAGTKPPSELKDVTVDLSGWSFQVDPREELGQMYREAWRLERDYFWDRGMHGLDWAAIRTKYQPLADRVTSREELSDVFGQMISELEALHMFVYGGDERKGDDDVLPASLGARLVRDSAAGGWRVAHVFRADPDQPEHVSPLAHPDVHVADGDVILAINGQPTLSVPDVGALLGNQAGKQVLLHVRSGSAERDVIVTPITPRQEADLRYAEWEYTRRLAVDSLSDGKIGYVHLRAMTGNDIAQWAREYYPAVDRQALIVDVRGNRGGNIDSWILEKLMRQAWMYWQPRVGAPYWNMQAAFRGPVVVLVDENTASDGEAFAEGFKRLGLGKVIGTRTWGGEIWLSSSNFLVDHGIATAAEMGVYGPKGSWLIEGHGVDPDVVVDNTPAATFAGSDAQLQAAVRLLLDDVARNPVGTPKAPAYPRKH